MYNALTRPKLFRLFLYECVYTVHSCIAGELTRSNAHTHVRVAPNAVLDYRTENILRVLITDSLLLTSSTATLRAPSSSFHFGRVDCLDDAHHMKSNWVVLCLCCSLIVIYCSNTIVRSHFCQHLMLALSNRSLFLNSD